MCLGVFSNGISSGKDTHISVYVYIMAGENDDCLQWPFVGDIGFEVLNWRKGKGHFKMNVCINKGNNFHQVAEGTIGMAYGLCFLPHLSLSYNSTTKTEYLQNDCLQLRVCKVVVYSPPHIVKAPSWQQDPNNASQSVCEFTLSEFSKRKLFNNSFSSPSFYTHQNGYKFCIRVFSNGRVEGENTHVSFYVILMEGKYDDQLQWPFIGNIVIELLNWRENRKHHKVNIAMKEKNGLVRVIQGEYGLPWGCHQFISHSSLSYNSTTNTEYLQDDCLRFRVSMTKCLHDINICTPSSSRPKVV